MGKTRQKIISLQEMWTEKEKDLEEETVRLNSLLKKAKLEEEDQHIARDNNQQQEDNLRSAIKEKVVYQIYNNFNFIIGFQLI